MRRDCHGVVMYGQLEKKQDPYRTQSEKSHEHASPKTESLVRLSLFEIVVEVLRARSIAFSSRNPPQKEELKSVVLAGTTERPV